MNKKKQENIMRMEKNNTLSNDSWIRYISLKRIQFDFRLDDEKLIFTFTGGFVFNAFFLVNYTVRQEI